MDIFTLKGLCNELNEYFKGSIVKKIYHKDYELFFKLFGSKEKKDLYINISPQQQKIIPSERKVIFQETPTSFCMGLRKYIQGKRIIKFDLPFFYRILEIRFDNFRFFIKFTGRSSDYILCDENMNILQSLSGVKGKFTVENVKIIESLEEFKIKDFKLEGLPPFAVKELRFIAEKYGINTAFDTYKKLVNFDYPFSPVLIEGKLYPFPLEHLKNKNDVKILNSFVEAFSIEPDFKKKLLKFLKDKIKRIEKNIKIVEDELNEALNYKTYERYGELLKANLYKKVGNSNYLKVFDYYENGEVEIPIDSSKSLVENMQYYFEKAKKMKRGVDKLKERLAQLSNFLNFYEELLFYAENTEDIEELKNIAKEANFIESKVSTKNLNERKLYEKYLIEGIPVYVGKSAAGNDYILKKFGNPDFLWCHVRGLPGAHVIVAKKMENLDEEFIERVCKIALEHSKAKNDKKGEVIYTKLKYIKKPKNALLGQVSVLKENVKFVKIP